MKVAIFENEFDLVRIAFELVNELFYANELSYEVFVSSQEFKEFDKIKEYNLVLVDIDLSLKSDLDGFGVIREILKVNEHAPIIILTGSSKISERLEELGLPNFPILLKPIHFGQVYVEFNKILKPKKK